MDSEVIHSEFLKTFPELVNNVMRNTRMGDMPETNKWLESVLEYNVPHGKLTRGMTVIFTYQQLNPDYNEEDLKLAYIMGWLVEIVQASMLIADDIMDASETRRGKPCWYRVGNNGVAAFNDAVLLENLAYEILKIYFREKSYYFDVIEFLHDLALKTLYGQSLDTRISLEKNIDGFDFNLYKRIVKYKTSYYTFYGPIWVAMTMAGLNNQKVFTDVEKMCLDIGYLFQAQDDYLDCFGDFEITGKIGTDIEDSKCTWLFVTAMEKADLQNKCILKELYANGDVEEVKIFYKNLKIDEDFKEFEDDMRNQILERIVDLPDTFPKDIALKLLDKMYRRIK